MNCIRRGTTSRKNGNLLTTSGATGIHLTYNPQADTDISDSTASSWRYTEQLCSDIQIHKDYNPLNPSYPLQHQVTGDILTYRLSGMDNIRLTVNYEKDMLSRRKGVKEKKKEIRL